MQRLADAAEYLEVSLYGKAVIRNTTTRCSTRNRIFGEIPIVFLSRIMEKQGKGQVD